MDLTMGRMRQIRDVIFGRREAEWRRTVRLEEAKLQILVGAVQGAAGNAKGARQAQKIRLLDDDPDVPGRAARDVPSVEQVSSMFPGRPAFTPEEIAAERERLVAEGVIVDG